MLFFSRYYYKKLRMSDREGSGSDESLEEEAMEVEKIIREIERR